MAVLLAVLVRRAVTRPLGALAAACRRIAEGNFAERIPPRGPKDIRAIAADVENMRQRIVDDLDASRAARAIVDEQTVELLRSNAELEQFAYVASHDLQEPLRKVASFCQLLEKRYGDKLDERGVEYIGFAVDGAKRMQVLINDLLTFSRVGRLNATAYRGRPRRRIGHRAWPTWRRAIEESGAEIRAAAQPLPHVDGDPTLLAMVWQNLIGNAVKFRRDGVAPHDRHRLRTRRRRSHATGYSAVSDNGIGIAPRSSPIRSSSSFSASTAVTRIAERALGWRCARRSSSNTAEPSGSTPPTRRERASVLPCPPNQRPSRIRRRRPFFKEHPNDTGTPSNQCLTGRGRPR